MSHNSGAYFSSNNLDMYLKELAKEFRRLNGRITPAEITLVGGAALLANYGFREKTYDIDVIIRASSAMKEAANCVRDKFNLPNNWFNSGFSHGNGKAFSAEVLSGGEGMTI